MKLDKKITRFLKRKSRSSSSNSLCKSSNDGSGSFSFDSGSSKSPQETPKSVLPVNYTASALKVPSTQPTTTEICIEEPSYIREETGCALPSCRVEELREIFKVFDSNNDGRISGVELGFVLRSLGDDLSEEELDLMVKDADKDGDGYIGFEEFISLNCDPAGADPATDELHDAFRIFDADKNGLISAEELHRVLRSLGDDNCTLEDCRRMIRGVDKDGDGHVDFEEFRIMMTC